MSWINRSIVRIGSALALIVLAAASLPALAQQQRGAYWFSGTRITFTKTMQQSGATMIAVDDPGLRALLDRLGAYLTWRPGERYALFTTAQPLVISFSIGETLYDVGDVSQQASVAPFERDGTVYVPFLELMRALDLEPKRDGADLVLQPQLASIDTRGQGDTVTVVANAGVPLAYRIVSQSSNSVELEFDGVGSPLQRVRHVDDGGLHEIDIRTEGSVRAPKTFVTLLLAPGASHGAPASDDHRDFTMAFSVRQQATTVAAQPTDTPQNGAEPSEMEGPASPEPSPSTTPQGPVAVTAVDAQTSNGAFVVNVALSGPASYEWHRLRAPDDRWYLDMHGARLQVPARDDPQSGPVSLLRVHQNTSDTVRIALSLTGQNDVTVATSPTGLTIAVAQRLAADDAPRLGTGVAGASVAAVPSPVPTGSDWKFAPRPGAAYVARNPRLIVIDPGHGGSDPGTIRGDLNEKTITLDMAKRLRDILVARGWQVVLTHDTDSDVYGPNASDRDEVQARVDVANNAGARLFVSVHVNGFMNAGPHGTTSFYSKPIDTQLAAMVQHRIVAATGMKDDGVVKSKLYVTLHTTMPAVLVETAFLSNPDDYAKLASPAWRQKVAQAIADGIGDYAGTAPSVTPSPAGG